MNIQNTIWYAAADHRRQVIPWIRVQGPDGKITEYVSTEKPLTPEELKKAEIRRMDCVDCHNRPSHRYLPPGRALDPSLQEGRISPELPFIKKVAVEAMVRTYATAEEADRGIETYIRDFYQKQYPAVAQGQDAKVKAAIDEVKRVYHLNFFPEMRVSWQVYPDNIGHKEFPGCFRCHDGKHVNADGKVIDCKCDSCHEFLERRAGGAFVRSEATPAFAHPWKLGGKHGEALGDACHTMHGANGLVELTRTWTDDQLRINIAKPARSASNSQARRSYGRIATTHTPSRMQTIGTKMPSATAIATRRFMEKLRVSGFALPPHIFERTVS